MSQFLMKPTLHRLDSVQEFVDNFQITADDVLFINPHLYNDYFAPLGLPCAVVHPKDYGAGEPTDEMIEAIDRDLTGDYKRVIAVGGGSVLDVAKFFVLDQTTPVLDLFDGKRTPTKARQLVLIPTTCGTGSEVTSVAALALVSRGTKAGYGTPAMFADDAVLIPALLEDLPMGPFSTSAIDALVHAVESALSPKATPISKLLSYEAIRLILRGFKKIAADGPDARKPIIEDFLFASTYAGVAFSNAGCAAVHALSYPLGGTFHVPHGESNYAMFTGVMRNYMEIKQDGEIATLNHTMAEILDCDVSDVYDQLEALLNHLVQKKPLHAYGMTEAQIAEFADSVYEKQQRLLVNNFVPFDRDRIYKIYKELY
ncbi:MAG: 4-hydroxybutyrate dehydrogenase [Peptococcaceae bacterium]|nr:4-hydroxybutyrate dehydrogenase [Peptococcaceae bacterium]